MRLRTVMALGVGMVLAFPALTRAQFPTFRTAFLASNPGKTPSGLGLGDFNGDGDMDVATSNSNGGSVTIFIQFDGEWFADHDETVGNVPSAVTVADFDEDGPLDLVVAHGNDGTITCLRGLGDGFFAAPTAPTQVVGSPVALAFGDVDQDGTLDVFVGSAGESESAPGSVSVLLGTGGCAFELDTTLQAETGTSAVIAADFNGDERLDIAATNARSGTVSVFVATGDGGFTKLAAVPTGPEPQDLAAGDLNEDGRLDLVTADKNGDAITVLIGNGNGGFTRGAAYQAGTAPSGVALADLTGDGHLDAAVSNNLSGDVSFLVGDGQGGFQVARSFVAEGQPVAVELGRLDSDDQIDVVSANLVGSEGSVAVLRNRGGGVLHGVEDVPAAGGPSSVAVGDLDGDALPDFVVTHESGEVLTFSSAGDGLRPGEEIASTGRSRGSVARDFDGDGRLDIALADNLRDVVTVLLGIGGGRFGASRDFGTAMSPASITVGDFDGDGVRDLAVPSFGPPGEVSILMGRGDGTFAPHCSTVAGEAPVSVAVRDFDRDGWDDMAVVNQGSDTVMVYASEGDCSFTLKATLDAAQQVRGPTSVISGLFDNDLIPDLAVGNSIASGIQPTVLVFLGNGDATFRFGSSSRADRVDALTARDFTGDGLVDLAAVDQTSNTVRVVRGRGDGRFSSESTASVSRMPVGVAAADVDGDGRYDAATANAQTTANNLSLLLSCVGDPGCGQSGGAPLNRGDGNGDATVSAADFVALARESSDDDGQEVEDVGRNGFAANRGVDANGDGRVDAQDGPATARWLFDPWGRG